MSLLMLILPLIVAVIVAMVTHGLISEFWSACWRSSLLFALTMLVWVLLVNFIFVPRPVSILDFFRYFLVASGYGIAGFGIAVLIGIPFYLDRQIQKRDQERSQ